MVTDSDPVATMNMEKVISHGGYRHINRRFRAVGIFSDQNSSIGLGGAVLFGAA